MGTYRVFALASMLVIAAESMAAVAQVGDNHTDRLASAGLGSARPSTPDRSQDARWRVYAFERDGIAYYQINDLTGRVHAIVAHMDGTFWALPAGERSARISVPTQRLVMPEGSVRSVVYEAATFELVAYGQGGETVWSVEMAE